MLHSLTYGYRNAAMGIVTSARMEPPAILGTLLREWWDARYGYTLVSGEVDSWAGQKLGLVITAPTSGERVQYGADGAHFGGRAVIYTASNGDSLRNASLGINLHEAGAKPYTMTVCRIPGNEAAIHPIWTHRGTGPVNTVGLLRKTNTASPQTPLANWDGQDVSIASDSNGHVIETWITAAGVAAISIDGAAATTAGSGLALDVAVISMNFFTDVATANGHASIAAHIECTSVPTDDQRTALRAWSLAVWSE